jgi:hypothetical protein
MKDVVELTLPVKADLVVLARLTAATVASREIEDLRLAVDELCVSLVGDGTDGRMTLRFTRDEDQIEVEGAFHAAPEASSPVVTHDPEGLSERILDALVDDHGFDEQDGQPRAWLRKRRARQQA